MKNIVSSILFLSFASWAAEQSIPTIGLRLGYVDLQRALESVDAGKVAKTTLEKEVTAKKADLEKQQAELQKEAEQFEKKAAILNENAKAAKQKELQKKFMDFQKSAGESQTELQKRERELTKPLIDELKGIVQGIGKEKSFQLILEKNEGAVLYAENGSDLTEAVIERFNSQHKNKPAEKGKKKNS